MLVQGSPIRYTLINTMLVQGSSIRYTLINTMLVQGSPIRYTLINTKFSSLVSLLDKGTTNDNGKVNIHNIFKRLYSTRLLFEQSNGID
jgi:hypothetical protein